MSCCDHLDWREERMFVCHDPTSCVRQAKGSVLSGLDRRLGETLEGEKEREDEEGASQQESKYGEQHSSRGRGDTARDLRLAQVQNTILSLQTTIYFDTTSTQRLDGCPSPVSVSVKVKAR